ncbi:MAG: HD domain-containing protein [Hyphomicrobiales bacterium]|nr:HD domain-containing protein [Hyphomicrobiales bacterium]
MADFVRLLHDDDADVASVVAALKRRLSVETVALSNDHGFAGLAEAATIVDVDLSCERTLRRLRGLLPQRGEHPRLIVVDRTARAERIQAGVFGATGLLVRPLVPEEVAERALAAIWAGRAEAGFGRGRTPMDAPGAQSILVAEETLAELFSACVAGDDWDPHRLEASGVEVTHAIAEIGFEAWMDTVRRHHGGTYRHSLLVTGVAVGFGTELGMARADVERLACAALAHDVGKVRVPIDVLDKPARLTAEEYELVKRHSEWGWWFLAGACRRPDPDFLDAVLHHHEALDGSGYPHGLVGAEISDLTRVLTICDVYAALSEPRPYKEAMRPPQIMEILNDMARQGKVETALVRAVGWIVAEGRASGSSPLAPPRRLFAQAAHRARPASTTSLIETIAKAESTRR